MIRRLLLITAVSGVAFTVGCKHRCCRLNDPENRPAPFRPQAPNSPFLLPPAGVPTAPAPVPAPSAGPIVPGVGPDMRNYPPPGPLAKPAPEVLLPDPIPGGASSRSFSPNNTGQGLLGGPTPPRTEPPLASKPADVGTGLPGFVKVQDGVATGRKPALDGFESLKRQGYRSVIYLYPTGADVAAAKDVAEKRGLKFVSIEVAPEKLPASLNAFNDAVGDKASRPSYVFDDDGVRTGAMWYLHFRTVEAMNDDAARIRARPLGFTNQGDEAQAFGLAIQRYLETR